VPQWLASGLLLASNAALPFKLVDGNIVSDDGIHELDDETMAQIEALKLAHSLSETRPEFSGKNYVLLVTDERGEVVCAIPLEVD
jgi:hypothetical protein